MLQDRYLQIKYNMMVIVYCKEKNFCCWHVVWSAASRGMEVRLGNFKRQPWRVSAEEIWEETASRVREWWWAGGKAVTPVSSEWSKPTFWLHINSRELSWAQHKPFLFLALFIYQELKLKWDKFLMWYLLSTKDRVSLSFFDIFLEEVWPSEKENVTVLFLYL